LRFGLSYFTPRLRELVRWVIYSREESNFTYELTDANLDYLAHTVAAVTQCSFERARGYIAEAIDDEELRQHVLSRVRASRHRYRSDASCHFGRRLGWYAFVRILRPAVVVETGVDKGHGAVLLCAALLRNATEGAPGRYYGTDINPAAGWLLGPPYSAVGEVLYGDSLESLQRLSLPIDLFINDSDHSAEYEYQEYLAVTPRLRPQAVILGDNAHATSSLERYSRERGRAFLFFQERPKDHWYPGAGIGISFIGSLS
jgi:predicted O-methyltransferase YrrM